MCSAKVAVHETVRSIAVRYVVLDELDRASGATLGPLQLATWASTRRGLVFCPEAHRAKSAATMATIPSELLDQLRNSGVKLRVLKAPLLGRCVALSGYELQSMRESEEIMILREDQCLPCCIKTALRDDALEIIVLSK